MVAVQVCSGRDATGLWKVEAAALLLNNLVLAVASARLTVSSPAF